MSVTTQRLLIGELRCIQCGRVIAAAREYPGGLHLAVIRPEYDPEAVRRLRCPVCLGNLRIEDTSVETHYRYTMTPADYVPKRGRPRKEPRP